MKKVLFIALVAVVAVPSFASASFDVNLKLGTRSPEVIKLQNFLMDEGCFKSLPTGYFGPITQRAVKCLQAKYKVSPANGVFGPTTRARINGGVVAGVSTAKPTPKTTVVATPKSTPTPTATPVVTPTPSQKPKASTAVTVDFGSSLPTVTLDPRICIDSKNYIQATTQSNVGIWDRIQIEVFGKRADGSTFATIGELERTGAQTRQYDLQIESGGEISYVFRYMQKGNSVAATSGNFIINSCTE